MSTEKLSNRGVTTLALSTNNTATTITVSSSVNFPTSGDFRILIDNEILMVTAVSGNAWTVIRGQETTVAAPHSQGATVAHVLTAGAIKKYAAESSRSSIYLILTSAGGNFYTNIATQVPVEDYSNVIFACLFLAGTNTGPATIKLNNMAALPVVRGDYQPTEAGDLQGGRIYILLCNGTNFVITGSAGVPVFNLGVPSVDRSIPIYDGTNGSKLTQQNIWKLPNDYSMRMEIPNLFNSNIYHLYNTTSNDTETDLFSDGVSTRIPVISVGSVWSFNAMVIAKTAGSNAESAAWEIKGSIHRNNNSTSIFGPAPSVIVDSHISLGDTMQGVWRVTPYADDVNETLGFKVIGQTGKNIRWVAKVQTLELTF